MSITGFSKIFSVNDSEYGYAKYGFMPGPSGMKIDVYVPKLMGMIEKEGNENIVINGLFSNAKDCGFNYDKKVKITKSFKAELKSNCNWLDKVNNAGYIVKDTQFIVEFLNGNIASPYITTK